MARQTDKRFLPLKLLSLETEGFSYFPRQEIILHNGITVLNGENGSGKTTFLNMLRVLFGANRFDNGHTFRTFFERKDTQEIYVIGRFDNAKHPVSGRRPFEGIGKTQDVVSVICRLMNEQPIRREYLIYDGAFELNLHMKGGLRWLESGQYLKQMSDVGLSRALVNAFSFNQGNTEKLLEKSEEELADYLLNICGEQERMERFQQIKAELLHQQQQFQQLDLLKAQEEESIKRISEKIQRCKTILEKNERLEQIDFDEPLAQFRDRAHQVQQHEQGLKELDTALRELEEQLRQYELDYVSKDETLNWLTEKLQELGQQLTMYRLHSNELQGNLYEMRGHLEQLEAFIEQYGGIPEESLELLEVRRLECESQYEEQVAERSRFGEKKRELEHKIDYIRTHKKIVYPPEVQQMLRKLNEAGAEHLLMAECIEIRDDRWREAIEALFGNERFTIAVDEKHIVSAMKWAQSMKYPYWISPYKPVTLTPQSTSVLSKVAVLDKRIAGYIAPFESYMLSSTMEEAWEWVRKGKQALLHDPHPYKVVGRGGRSIAARGLFCGKLAYEAQLREAEHQLEQLIPMYEQMQRQVEEAKELLAQAEHQLHVQQQVRLLPEKHTELEEESVVYTRLDAEARQLSETIDTAEKDRSALHHQGNTLQHELGQLTAKLEVRHKELEDTIRTKAQLETALGVLREDADHWKRRLSERQLAMLEHHSYMEQLLTPDRYEAEMQLLQAVIASLRNLGNDYIAPGEEKRTLALEEKYAAHQTILEQHRKEIEKVQSELEQLQIRHLEAEAEYVQMVEDVFVKIRRSLDELTRSTNMNVVLRAFHLGEQRWKVDYRIGFHGKAPSSYRNKSDFSGGQKVIASLLLTFAAAKADGVLSFMVLDEPFAHLDHERIKLVGDFLKKSDVQYIIAMPYTENLKLVMPWVDMLINLRPKHADEEVAPPITYGGIDDEYIDRHSLYHA